jgi:4-hydroxy-tetrahydrodipicolinate synthase
MSDTRPFGGVLAPVATPFTAEYEPDPERLVQHCRWLRGYGVGLALFGTNSEGNSLSVDEKLVLLDAVVAAGLDPAPLMPGTGHCALTDSIRLTRRAVALGCGGVLVLPPFYYKDVTEEGLFRTFAALIDSVGDSRLRLYLYHIPQITQVPITAALIARLRAAYPGVVAGVKDSGGDWGHTERLLDAFGRTDFAVFSGSERFLLDTLRHGGAGCISATVNVNPGPIAHLRRTWQMEGADLLQQQLTGFRAAFSPYPLIPALKAAIAHYRADPAWSVVRPPLVELPPDETQALVSALDVLGFSMSDPSS